MNNYNYEDWTSTLDLIKEKRDSGFVLTEFLAKKYFA